MKFTICDDTPSDLLAMENALNQYAKLNNISIDIEKHSNPDSLIKRVMFSPDDYRIFLLDVVMQSSGIELANKVVNEIENHDGALTFKHLYDENLTIKQKITTICKEIYGADGVEFTTPAKNSMASLKKNGWDKLPICIAKTQYSFSDNPKLLGKPEGFTITIRDLKPSVGAGFIIALSGDIMTMPGLPKEPAANKMDIIDGKTVGLF